MNIDGLLTSTVVAGLVSGIITLLQFKKSNSLKYITEERQKWRIEIRDIIVELEKSIDRTSKIKPILAKLKGRINAYGLNHSKSYSKDFHIWQIIKQIENHEDVDLLKDDKQLLIDFLALLLKNDWERSKNEIEGDKQNNLNNVLFIISIILFTFMAMTDLNELFTSAFTTNDWGKTFPLYFLPIIHIGFSFIIFFFIWHGPDIFLYTLMKKQKKKKNKKEIKKLKEQKNKKEIERLEGIEVIEEVDIKEGNTLNIIKFGYFLVPMFLFLSVNMIVPMMLSSTEKNEILVISTFTKTIIICILWTIGNLSKFDLRGSTFINKQEYYFSIHTLLCNRNSKLADTKSDYNKYKIKIPPIKYFE